MMIIARAFAGGTNCLATSKCFEASTLCPSRLDRLKKECSRRQRSNIGLHVDCV